VPLLPFAFAPVGLALSALPDFDPLAPAPPVDCAKPDEPLALPLGVAELGAAVIRSVYNTEDVIVWQFEEEAATAVYGRLMMGPSDSGG
jgi:hypothetical protein